MEEVLTYRQIFMNASDQILRAYLGLLTNSCCSVPNIGYSVFKFFFVVILSEHRFCCMLDAALRHPFQNVPKDNKNSLVQSGEFYV